MTVLLLPIGLTAHVWNIGFVHPSVSA